MPLKALSPRVQAALLASCVQALLVSAEACTRTPVAAPVPRQSWDTLAGDLRGGVRFHYYGVPPGSEAPLRALIRFSYSGRTHLTDSEQFNRTLTRRTREDTVYTTALRTSAWFEVTDESPIDVEIMILTPENDTAAVAVVRTLVRPGYLTSVSISIERQTPPIDRAYLCRHCHGWRVFPIRPVGATGPSDSLVVNWAFRAR